MITSINGRYQGYYYIDGYLRTSSKEFCLKNLKDRYIHLTNDAVQKKSESYGRHEPGNKMSYPEFDTFLRDTHGVSFYDTIEPKIRSIITDTIKAAESRIDCNRRMHTFEIFGYDFMIDESFNVWLIEINTNPCLVLSCGYLERLIPSMLDNAFRIAVDPLFPERKS
jgi:hypothetical protein